MHKTSKKLIVEVRNKNTHIALKMHFTVFVVDCYSVMNTLLSIQARDQKKTWNLPAIILFLPLWQSFLYFVPKGKSLKALVFHHFFLCGFPIKLNHFQSVNARGGELLHNFWNLEVQINPPGIWQRGHKLW